MHKRVPGMLALVGLVVLMSACPNPSSGKNKPEEHNNKDPNPDGTGTTTALSISFLAHEAEDIDLSMVQDSFVVLKPGAELQLTAPEGCEAPVWYVNADKVLQDQAVLNLDYTQLAALGRGVHGIHLVTRIDGIPYSRGLRFRITQQDIQSVLVTFDSRGGSPVESRMVESGSRIPRPADPLRNGYNLAGWGLEEDTDLYWNFEAEQVLEDTLLYAQWEQQHYSIQYFANGADEGSLPPVQVAAYGETLTIAEAGSLDRTEAVFTGWNTRADGSGLELTAGSTVTMQGYDLELYAQWLLNRYSVFFYGNEQTSGPAMVERVYEYGSEFVLPNAQELEMDKENNLFTGWSVGTPDGDTVSAAGSTLDMGNEDLHLYARWQPASVFSISFAGIHDEELDLDSNAESTLSLSAYNSLRIEAPFGYASYRWFINGSEQSENSAVLELDTLGLETLGLGMHSVSLIISDHNAVPWSGELIFRIVF